MATGPVRSVSWGAGTALVLASLHVAVAPPPAVAASDLEVVDVGVTTTGDVATGFATVTLDVALRSASGLDDDLIAGVMGTDDMVLAERLGPTPLAPGESVPVHLGWRTLTRVSGTANDGVWRGTTTVSRVFGGTWLISSLFDDTTTCCTYVDLTDLGRAVELNGGDPPGWVAAPAPLAPVKVVTGTEPWTPRGRITDRATGAGVAGFWLDHNFYAEPYLRPAVRLAPGAGVNRADAQGFFTLPTRPVTTPDGEQTRHLVHAYAGRGSRGFSWEAETSLWPHVKWQANERFAVTGRTVVASGNAWPAPSVYEAANPTIHLQHMVGRTWRTVASSHVRANGRYTIEWTAPTSGPQVVRVYKPGGSERNGQITSAGSTLATVTVSTS